MAKLVLGAGAALAFAAGLGLARVTYAGHSKQPERPLTVPQPMYDVVRARLMQAGAAMPASAPAEATTHSS